MSSPGRASVRPSRIASRSHAIVGLATLGAGDRAGPRAADRRGPDRPAGRAPAEPGGSPRPGGAGCSSRSPRFSLCCASSRAAGRDGPRLARAPTWLLLVAAGTLYAGVGLRHAAGLQVSGDEPHYLVMAQSLWRDHDLDLRDEYDGEEWAEFVPGPLRPHWGAPRADGRPFPAHSPGLPLLLAPAYAALGREGCVLVMALVAAAAALVCRRLALQLTGDEAASLVGVARGGRATALLLLVPPLHGGAVGARGGRLAGPAPRGAGRRGSRARRAVCRRAAVAARQDDPGRGRARPHRARPPARARPGRVPGRGGRGRGRVRSLLRLRVRPGLAPRALRRRSGRRAGPLLALAAGALPRPLLRPVADRARLPARARRAAVRPAPARGLAPCARRAGRARAPPVVAHVVGRPVPAGEVPGADAAVPRRRAGAAARALPGGPRALVPGPAPDRRRALGRGRGRARPLESC